MLTMLIGMRQCSPLGLRFVRYEAAWRPAAGLDSLDSGLTNCVRGAAASGELRPCTLASWALHSSGHSAQHTGEPQPLRSGEHQPGTDGQQVL